MTNQSDEYSAFCEAAGHGFSSIEDYQQARRTGFSQPKCLLCDEPADDEAFVDGHGWSWLCEECAEKNKAEEQQP